MTTQTKNYILRTLYTLRYKDADGHPQHIDVIAESLDDAKQAAEDYFTKVYGKPDLLGFSKKISGSDCLVVEA